VGALLLASTPVHLQQGDDAAGLQER